MALRLKTGLFFFPEFLCIDIPFILLSENHNFILSVYYTFKLIFLCHLAQELRLPKKVVSILSLYSKHSSCP
jgi:hypothetical protein